MNDESVERNAIAAAREVAQLDARAQRLREEIATLRRERADLDQDLDGMRALQLLEANERLVLAALHSDSVAEAAVSDLGELARSSQRDTLTDTPNRALMLDRLESALAMARRRGTRAAVLFVDLDDFKKINDTLGHAVGDDVMQWVARRLEAVVRHSDTVSRHGGDEFLVLLTEISVASDAEPIAEKILSALAAPCGLDSHVLHLSASIGIAIFPEDGDDSATLIGCADAAMYRSKRRVRGGFEFHAGPVAPRRGGGS
ncbi:MAG: GGDEF domain-containing protein [Caldimonas sp.]